MHGRPRLPAGQSPDHSKDHGKAEKLSLLMTAVLRNHHERCYTKEALKQSAQLLEINPEFYTAWNYRKLAIRHLMDLESDGAARKRLAEGELRLVEAALRANVKSYGAWYHRKWIIGFGLSSLDHEILLLQKLLKDDARNFHGWNYRRFAVRAKGLTAEQELKYTTDKINENFSNYSAWHYRSALLSQLVKGGASRELILKDEYDLVNQAYFTEPDDQSAWFYTSWLLGQTRMDSGANLVGTWPSNGSSIVATVADRQSSLICVEAQNPFDKKYSFDSIGLPVVLLFSEPVTDVVVKASSRPTLPGLNDIKWSPLSGVQERHSKTWAAQLLLQACPDMECAISLSISTSATSLHEVEIKFNLQVSTGQVSQNHDESDVLKIVRDGASLWPSRMSDEGFSEKRRQRLQEGNAAPAGKLLSDDFLNVNLSAIEKADWRRQVLEQQIQNLRELLELEEHSKWAKLTLAQVLLVNSTLTGTHGQYTVEVLNVLKELMERDPVHKDYYESQLSTIFIAKVLRNPNSLKELWWDSHSDGINRSESWSWLRWNGLSLSKFVSVEKMLWVQRLDLSHNHLRTVDGLEAMHLLVALDLSYNCLPQVTCLACLRLNPQLRFLNISHNEIGDHPVDSSRYSFPSLLTNQVNAPCHLEKDDATKDDEWEVEAIFGGLALSVLEISGNRAASDTSFREAIVKALPRLQFLDGEQIQ